MHSSEHGAPPPQQQTPQALPTIRSLQEQLKQQLQQSTAPATEQPFHVQSSPVIRREERPDSVRLTSLPAKRSTASSVEARLAWLEEREAAHVHCIAELQQEAQSNHTVVQQQQKIISQLERLMSDANTTIAQLLARNHELEMQLGEQQEVIMEHHEGIASLQRAASAFESDVTQQQSSISVLVEEIGRLRLRMGTGRGMPTKQAAAKPATKPSPPPPAGKRKM